MTSVGEAAARCAPLPKVDFSEWDEDNDPALFGNGAES